jgi:hypothetical protein
LHGENEVFHFQRNRNDFPKVSFTLDVIWGHMGALFCNWKLIKWLGYFFKSIFFYGRDRPRSSNFFTGVFGCPFPDLHCVLYLWNKHIYNAMFFHYRESGQADYCKAAHHPGEGFL